MNVLVTGGLGYIGSHTVVQLIEAGNDVIIVDNLSNSKIEVLSRITMITGKNPVFVKGDIRDRLLMDEVFGDYCIDGVMHFAGLKSVGESVAEPLRYYQNNVIGTLSLLESMKQAECQTLVFSSSATVYGDPEVVPITEDAKLSSTNPYGRSKLMVEGILRDLSVADQKWRVALLRYFNPVGAHESGLIGEDPDGVPANIMPYIAQVAVGKRPKVCVFGGDYPTPDGSGVRDYLHVVDLADAHLKALSYLQNTTENCSAFNLGTGTGYSVLELISAFRASSGKEILYEVVERRVGDIAECYADPSLSEKKLHWKAARDLKVMVRDHWNWQKGNPEGYM